jgi:hypothetical protein
MNQSVMTFSSSAARATAIPTPTEGMVTYLEDTNLYTGYNGTAWTSLGSLSGAALVHIASTTFSAQTHVQVNNCFSADYDVYKVVFNNLTIASGDPLLSWQMVSGTTPVATTTYNSQRLSAQSTSVIGSASLNQTSGFMGFVGSATPNFVSMEIGSPFLAAQTKSISQVNYANQNIEINYARHANATSYNGIKFILGSSTMTGTVRIYGYRNA